MKKFLFSLVVLLGITTASNALAHSIFMQRNLNAIASVLNTLTPQKLNTLAQLLQNPDTIPADHEELHELARFLNTMTPHEAEQLERILQDFSKVHTSSIQKELAKVDAVAIKKPSSAVKRFFETFLGKTVLTLGCGAVIVCYYKDNGIQETIVKKWGYGPGVGKAIELALGAIFGDLFKNNVKAFFYSSAETIVN